MTIIDNKSVRRALYEAANGNNYVLFSVAADIAERYIEQAKKPDSANTALVKKLVDAGHALVVAVTYAPKIQRNGVEVYETRVPPEFIKHVAEALTEAQAWLERHNAEEKCGVCDGIGSMDDETACTVCFGRGFLRYERQGKCADALSERINKLENSLDELLTEIGNKANEFDRNTCFFCDGNVAYTGHSESCSLNKYWELLINEPATSQQEAREE